MTRSRVSGNAPWITAVALAVLAAALAVLLWGFILPDRHGGHSAFSARETKAMNAASVEVTNLLTYSRKDYDADFARALAGTTGALRSDLNGRKAQTRAQLVKGKFDLKGKVTHVALAGTDDKGRILVLVEADGYKITNGTASTPLTQRLEVTMTSVDGKWQASDLQAKDLQ